MKLLRRNYQGAVVTGTSMIAAGILALLPTIILATDTHAATNGRIAENPAEAALTDRDGNPLPDSETVLKNLATMPATRGPGNQIYYNLNVTFTEGKIYNPTTDQYDAVKLRSLVGDVTSEKTPFVGPEVNIWPGETFRLTLNNQLPDDPSCYNDEQPPNMNMSPNTPHCFNGTNMHTHGLWISPTGNSDNVLLKIDPSVSFQYEYNIPTDHPAGTFWYHPHLHGSTALQVSSGMSGALIIHGNRLPEKKGEAVKTGDIDTLLRNEDGTPFKERVVLFQQNTYACLQNENDTDPQSIWNCKQGQTGEIENYSLQFGPGTWNSSGRYTMINGKVIPYFKDIQTGDVERWRFIHAGVRDTINLRFQKLATDASEEEIEKAYKAAISADEKQALVDKYCSGTIVEQTLIATDGLTRAQASFQDETVFQPGYREDMLLSFTEPGNYCMIDYKLNTGQTINEQQHKAEILALVMVSGEPAQHGSRRIISDKLIVAAENFMPANLQSTIAQDLKDNLKLSSFVPHPTIKDDEIKGERTIAFNIDTSTTPAKFQIGELDLKPGNQPYSIKNAASYQSDVINQKLALNNVEEWKIGSTLAGHPFHIHVNPFQIVSVLDEKGKDVTQDKDSQYYGYAGVWRDTIFVQQDYLITMRTRYQRYIGEFVLHCHILDHEDQGMMQNVGIYLTNGRGNISTGGHH